MQSKFWNDRYADSEYAYGLEPNDFLKQQYFKPKSKILCLAEGEGSYTASGRKINLTTTLDFAYHWPNL